MARRANRWQSAATKGSLFGLVAVVCLVLLGGCGAQPQEAAADQASQVDASQSQSDQATSQKGAAGSAQSQKNTTSTFDGGSMDIQGKTLTVHLDADPASGYRWSASIEGDGLELKSSSQGSAGESSLESGGSSQQQFMFSGTGKGDQVITLTYKKGNETSVEDKDVTIAVATNESGIITSADAATLSGAEASAASDTNETAESAATTTSSVSPDAANAANAGSGTDANVPVATSDNTSASQ